MEKLTPGQRKLVEGLNKIGISNETIMGVEQEMRKKENSKTTKE